MVVAATELVTEHGLAGQVVNGGPTMNGPNRRGVIFVLSSGSAAATIVESDEAAKPVRSVTRLEFGVDQGEEIGTASFAERCDSECVARGVQAPNGALQEFGSMAALLASLVRVCAFLIDHSNDDGSYTECYVRDCPASEEALPAGSRLICETVEVDQNRAMAQVIEELRSRHGIVSPVPWDASMTC